MTTPQGSQTSQSRSDVFSTATEHLNTESDAKSVNAELVAEHRWGVLDIIKKGHLERSVTGLVGYIPEIVKEFYAALPGEITRASKDWVEVTVRGHRNLTTRYLSPCKAALVILSAYNWVPSSHKNAVSADRVRLIYKMFPGIRVDVGEMFYAQILNLAVLQKEGGKKDTRWLILPRTIFGVLQTQFELERKSREKLSPVIPYKKDYRLAPSSGPPPSTPRSERTAPSGYVPPRQSPRAAGKFQIIHLGSIAAPGQPIDAEEVKLALDMTFEAIQQLATAMQTLTSVGGQIASMLFPRGEEEADDPQQQDDQGN
ncbi:hypothetical protein F2Q69_00004182 [Brassica cretica]|uniref:Uncharacterized protein n=1 Tax=Brassica cretica TaxID=69181 RepID=A0A8S9PK04_BRACR|nr:hypothetical protein F2Q69_00004182 [Brassica cretica]